MDFIPHNVCRCCGSEALDTWLHLSELPITNNLSYDPDLSKFPLELKHCLQCNHLQLASSPNLDDVFLNYRHKTSISNFTKAHFQKYADTITSRYNSSGVVLDIGSNDGYLLQQFKNKKWIVYGVEPSRYLKRDHVENRIPIYTDFFSTKLVDNNEWRNYFDVICVNNTLERISDTHDFLEAISMALKPDGLLVIESLHQEGIFSAKYLDNVSHECIDYYSSQSFAALCQRNNLIIEDMEKLDIHGVSFRAYLKKGQGQSNLSFSRTNILDFSDIENRRNEITQKINNRKFIVYGAGAKAVNSLHTLNLINNIFGVVDDDELKQGCFFPGTNIMITQPENMNKSALVLVTAWNLYEDIRSKLISFGHSGEILCI